MDLLNSYESNNESFLHLVVVVVAAAAAVVVVVVPLFGFGLFKIVFPSKELNYSLYGDPRD